MKNNLEEYPFPVYHTRGGMYCRFQGDILISMEDGVYRGKVIHVGDRIPELWENWPANKLAKEAYFK